MKKVEFLIFCAVAVAALLLFTVGSPVLAAPPTPAENVSHTITIVNDSNIPLKSAGGSFQKANYGSQASCGIDACPAENNLAVNSSTIAANSTGTVTMTGPKGCRVMGFMSYWTPDLQGKNGQIQCAKTWANVCNAGLGNLTCTISQDNADAVKGNSKAAVAATVQ